jgi:CrcB protein
MPVGDFFMEKHMLNLLIIGAGGFIGAVLRYLTGIGIHRLLNTYAFPYGTLAVNVLGCAVIGLLAGLAASRGIMGPELRTFLFIGLLGGFTTFSTFGFETLMLGDGGRLGLALVNVLANVGLGLGAAWAAYALAQRI